MRKNRVSWGTVNCLVCARFLLPWDEPPRPPALSSHTPIPYTLAHPSPTLSLCPPSSLLFSGLQGLGSHPSRENQDLKCQVAGDRGSISSPYGRAGSRWQRVSQTDWISETGLQSLEGTEALSRKPSRDTVPRNGAQGGGLMTKNKVGAQLQKQARELRGTSREEVVYL